MEKECSKLIKEMYDESGKFIPLTGNSGNISEDLAYLRNIYMEAEKDYFKYILSSEDNLITFQGLLDLPADDLFRHAIRTQQCIESGDLETNEEKIKMQLMSPE